MNRKAVVFAPNFSSGWWRFVTKLVSRFNGSTIFRTIASTAIVIKLRTCQRHSRAGGNPPPHLSSRWIPACAGMTGKRPIDHGYRYNWIANYLQFLLAAAKVSPLRLIRIHSLELQVPVLQPNDAANRYPDLVLLRPEHLDLMKRRLTITLDMPPPRLIAEVVSPGTTNRDRDYIYKRAQYAAVSVPEY